jgi:hypothetical protein
VSTTNAVGDRRDDPIEKWLTYARDVLTHGREQCTCDVARREPRWPGYIGARYPQGRVFLVGSSHFTANLFTPEISALMPIARAWANGTGVADKDYLEAVRSAYVASFPSWGGQVWTRFEKIVSALGLDWEDVAFTNLAKCHMPSDDDDTIVSCLRTFPINALVVHLDPIATLLAKDSTKVTAAARIRYENRDDRLVRRYNNRNGNSGSQRCEGDRGWLAADIERYWDLRGSLNAGTLGSD